MYTLDLRPPPWALIMGPGEWDLDCQAVLGRRCTALGS